MRKTVSSNKKNVIMTGNDDNFTRISSVRLIVGGIIIIKSANDELFDTEHNYARSDVENRREMGIQEWIKLMMLFIKMPSLCSASIHVATTKFFSSAREKFSGLKSDSRKI